MTTEGSIIPIERDLDILLAQTTFQDMSDSEIQKIIEFYKKTSYDTGYTTGYEDARTKYEQEELKHSDKILSDMLYTIQNTDFAPKLIAINGGEI